MACKQLREVLGIAMIGEGVIGSLRPSAYLRLWKFGPRVYQNVVEGMAQRPTLMRKLFVLEAVAGLALAVCQTRTCETCASEQDSAAEGELSAQE